MIFKSFLNIDNIQPLFDEHGNSNNELYKSVMDMAVENEILSAKKFNESVSTNLFKSQKA